MILYKDESSDLFGFGYPYREEDYEAFNEWILSLCREYRDQLDDGVFIEREDMAEQIKRYGTFIDRESVDHAELGADILFNDRLIDFIPRIV